MLLPSTCFLVFLVSLILYPIFSFDLSKFKDTGLLIPSLSLTPIDTSNQWAWKSDLFTGLKVPNTIKPKLILKRKNCKSKTCLLTTSRWFWFFCLSVWELQVMPNLNKISSHTPNLLLPQFLYLSKCHSIHSMTKAKTQDLSWCLFSCHPIVSLSIDNCQFFIQNISHTYHSLSLLPTLSSELPLSLQGLWQ